MKPTIPALLTALVTLTSASTALADARICLQARGTTATQTETLNLQGIKVWHGFGYTSVLTTNNSGCVTIPSWFRSVDIKVQAENDVAAVLNGIGVAQSLRTVSDRQTLIMGEHFYLAQKLKSIYQAGLAGEGPFGSVSPTSPPWVITAVIDSRLVIRAPFVEPSPAAGTALPRLHLPILSQVSDGTLAHERGHAVHMAQLAVWERDVYEAEYFTHLVLCTVVCPDGAGWSPMTRETPLVAWVEAFGIFAEVFADARIGGSEAELLRQANLLEPPDSLNTLGASVAGIESLAANTNRWFEDVPATIYALLFLDFANEVGLDFVLDRYVDCGAHNLQAFSQCISDRYGRFSFEHRALRSAASRFFIPLDVMQNAWDFCSEDMPCGPGMGDCDNHNQCQGQLRCRSGRDTSTPDYCAPSTMGAWDYCSEEFPCEVGEGDCDNADQCVGNATCPQISGVDYCVASRLRLPLPIVWP